MSACPHVVVFVYIYVYLFVCVYVCVWGLEAHVAEVFSHLNACACMHACVCVCVHTFFVYYWYVKNGHGLIVNIEYV